MSTFKVSEIKVNASVSNQQSLHDGIWVDAAEGAMAGDLFHVRAAVGNTTMVYNKQPLAKSPATYTTFKEEIGWGTIKKDDYAKFEEVVQGVKPPKKTDPCGCQTWTEQARQALIKAKLLQ